MPHPIPGPPVPAWKGMIFVVLGTLVALFSPKLVAFQLKTQQSLSQKMLGPIDYDQSSLLRHTKSVWYQRYVLFSTWFAVLLVAAMFLLIGIAIMLGLMPENTPHGTQASYQTI